MIELAKLIVSILGFAGTIYALYFGFRQYKRAEQWKRAEFVAKEVKEFESNSTVRNAMQLIDWGERKINLFQSDRLAYDDCIKVTRDDQWRALVPHTVKKNFPSLEIRTDAEKEKRFTSKETIIRDTYDEFLNYLQRFGNYIESDLVSPEELKPYLYYWIQSIAQGDIEKDDDLIEDNNWRCVLLCYINFYNSSSVIRLFSEFGFDISPDGEVFKQLAQRKISNKLLTDLLPCLKPQNIVLKTDNIKSSLTKTN